MPKRLISAVCHPSIPDSKDTFSGHVKCFRRTATSVDGCDGDPMVAVDRLSHDECSKAMSKGHAKHAYRTTYLCKQLPTCLAYISGEQICGVLR